MCPFLFPVPSFESASFESVNDLLDVALKKGSLSTCLEALPPLDNRRTITVTCTALMHSCIGRFDEWFENALDTDVMREEISAAGDIFRYSVTIGQNDCLASNGHQPDDDEHEDSERGYSILCGVFGRRKITTSSKSGRSHAVLLINGQLSSKATNSVPGKVSNIDFEALAPWNTYSADYFQSVSGVIARYLISSIFTPAETMSWTKVGILSRLLLGDSKQLIRFCTPCDFADRDPRRLARQVQ